jgi:hypothetical protein
MIDSSKKHIKVVNFFIRRMAKPLTEIPCWAQPVQGESTKETDRVAAAKESLPTFFS